MLYLFLCLLSCQFSYSFEKNKGTFETYAVSSYNRGVNNAVKSSVELHCYNEGVFTGKGSGNYIQEGDYKFILTANHVVDGCEEIQILNRDKSAVLGEVKYANKDRDVSILLPLNELYGVEPTYLRLETKKRILGDKIYFMGHPDDLRFFLFEGMVAMESENDIFLHSTAWGGVSGAVVFSDTGKIIGIAKAVKVVVDPITGIPRLMEDMVLVSKTDFLSRRFLKNIMDGK